jgi:hypothetical protein
MKWSSWKRRHHVHVGKEEEVDREGEEEKVSMRKWKVI